MITSMTGFARREATGPWGTLVCELRSVNHRFLETSFRLPDDLRALEPELRQLFMRQLKRGKVDCTLSYRAAQGAERALDIDYEVLARLLTRLREVGAALAAAAPAGGGTGAGAAAGASASAGKPTSDTPNRPASGAPRDLTFQSSMSPLDVLRWPGIIREAEAGTAELVEAGRKLAAAAVSDLAAARAREGERLRELIEQRCGALAELVEAVRARLPEVEARIRARLDERLSELQAAIDHDRLEQELALLLQRLDVDEELDRLVAHIAEIRRVVGGNEPAGRRLDFLMQELNREANTLSSKSQDIETTRAAVDMKVLIEQMREQVQNVE
ncbi:MAG TPA: YicC/YloC family endoribonuclease [Steroidobacteraceae bacterium]|nr:YicC/YloC family endoribonuclease [Steroidobacteraceae bacterium]